LRDLLNHSPGARDVLPHLAGVERALKALGLAAFEGLPSFVLNRAASQLESVFPDPPGPGITELRQRIAKALAAHEEARAPATAPEATPVKPTTYVSNDQLQVSETTHTDFMRVLEASQNKY
jgi:hypothetical protein